jgi:uridine kinase
VQDLVEKALIERGHARTAKAYILYRYEHALKRAGRRSLTYSADNIPYEKLWEALSWAVDHASVRLAEIAAAVREGRFAGLVQAGERFYARELDAAAEAIRERLASIRLVIVAGPSSSGKTTTTLKIEERLAAEGSRFVPINVDNFFLDLAEHPRDPRGDYDFETPQALDIDMINQHLHRLLAGEEVLLPYYDFKTGKQYPNRTPMKLKEGDIILIDSLYGLYPPLTDGIADNMVNLYIEPLLQMKDDEGVYVRWTDMRLMRRMLRDSVHRAYGYEMTLTHWHYVRAGELRGIIPYIGSADFIINSGMPYELPIYKPKLFDGFSQWVEKYRDDPLRQDAFERASRLHKLLSAITAVEDESIIPKDSVIREFIGGLDLEETQSV